jgi:5,6-dimethylbenzimidazole synthase
MNPTPPLFDEAFRADLHALFRWRRDVRRFAPMPLPPGALDLLLDRANLAPSVGLSQPWRFVTVEDPARRAAIRANFATCNAAALAAQPSDRGAAYARLKLAGLDEAPCHLAVETTDYSAVMAVHTLWLAARAMELGLGWVSILDPAAVGTALSVPPTWRFIGYFCLGYPSLESETPELERLGWETRHPPTLLRR